MLNQTRNEKWISIGIKNAVIWGRANRPKESIHTPVVGPCQFCHKLAVVALPVEFAAKQADNTTHVCHPVLGGCNQGFEMQS